MSCCESCGCSVSSHKTICRNCQSRREHPWWPRGRRNGLRIVGCSVKVAFDATMVFLIPRMFWTYQKSFHWLGINVWFEVRYD